MKRTAAVLLLLVVLSTVNAAAFCPYYHDILDDSVQPAVSRLEPTPWYARLAYWIVDYLEGAARQVPRPAPGPTACGSR